ncbi:hypothetical protein CAPTEDRAFT_198986 [Capitella teleta]|uniref:Secreted protein n=1 Tax=Capitella teleta TaxID=283909 RepID=R7VBD3_CAPTE|nr:hypothetical protein CAPTEDRAFT_198986 [Capitella teleta]|eukprot:ELU15857.1 hypothetical protein CAPTEDRAFT_198986 [Capitella teleta]
MALRINRVTDLSHVISLLVVMVSIGQVYTLNNDNDSTWNNNFDDEGLTCWTCPNKTDNEICNDWAPDKECSPNHTVCKTVHRIDAQSGDTLGVFKQCSLPRNCNYDVIGCHATESDGVQVCSPCQ